jgi:hypothetical protein
LRLVGKYRKNKGAQMARAIEQQIQSIGEETNSQETIVDKSTKKTKVTVYLTEEAEKAFTELYIARYRKDRKVDRSAIACEAIQDLFEKELGCP